MISPRDTSGGSDPEWQKRWQLLGSVCAMTFAVVVVVMTSHKAWHWPLFLWGFAIGIAGLAVMETVFLVIIRNAEGATDEQRERLKRRQIIYVGEWLFIGAFAGALSAGLDAAWIDIVFAVGAAISLIAGVVAIITWKRRHPPAAEPPT